MILLILIWGYAWIATKIALRYASALDVSVVRVALGTLFLFAFLLWSKASLRPAHWKWLIVIGLLQTAMFTITNVLALDTTPLDFVASKEHLHVIINRIKGIFFCIKNLEITAFTSTAKIFKSKFCGDVWLCSCIVECNSANELIFC